MKEKLIETRTAKIFLGEDNIIKMIYLKHKVETLEDAIKNVNASAEISNNQKLPLIVDLRLLKSIDRKVRAYYAGDEMTKVFKACVVLVDSFISKTMGNFFINFSNPKTPVKLFSDEKKGIKWLKGFVK